MLSKFTPMIIGQAALQETVLLHIIRQAIELNTAIYLGLPLIRRVRRVA
jgi:hypothetical protein